MLSRLLMMCSGIFLVVSQAILVPVQVPATTQVRRPKVAAAAEIGKFGGALVTAQISDPRTFNPIVAQEDASTNLLAPIFEGLLSQNYLTGDLEPALAESWTVSDDSRTWTFTLRDDVEWSDGHPLTAEDVAFTLAAIFTPGVQTGLADLLTLDEKPVRYRKLDARRVQFTTERPAGLFLRLIAAVPILPQHRLASVLAKGGAEFSKAWSLDTPPQEIIGTGPFVLESYVPGQRVTYLRNAHYWMVDARGNRLPYLTRYEVLIVPDREAARAKFVAGETDAYDARAREFADLQRDEKSGNYTVYDGPETLSAQFLVLNQNPGGVAPPKLAWFQDVQFRRALDYGIDRQAIVDHVYAGRAVPAWGPVSPANTLYAHSMVPQYRYDLRRAQDALEQAGYQKGPDGALRDSQGTPVEFVLSTNAGNVDQEAIGSLVRQSFAKLGVKVTFAPEPFNTLAGKLVITYQWDAIVIALTGKIEPAEPSAHGREIWLSSGPLHLWYPKQEQAATSWEAEIDRLFDQIGHELDPEKRATLYRRWQVIVATQVPLMYFAYPKTQPAVRNTLGNVQPGLEGTFGRLTTLYYKGATRP